MAGVGKKKRRGAQKEKQRWRCREQEEKKNNIYPTKEKRALGGNRVKMASVRVQFVL